MSFEQIKVIAFDADDTLWVNEPFFRVAEKEFCDLLKEYMPASQAHQLMHEMQMQNLSLYGYGIKPFTLSLIEAAIQITQGDINAKLVQDLIDKGKQMLQEPVEILEGITQTLAILSKKYRLVVATKGDLLDQERKLMRSGLQKYFHHIEIVSNKTQKEYHKLVQHLDIQPHQFLMVGNSLKSDIVPVLEIGAHAIHIPFHTTWIHEMVEEDINHPNFRTFSKATDLLEVL